MAASIFNSIIVFVVVLCPLAKSIKKYDLNTESFRLFGENFDAVLNRFRKTPAYLSIIKEKYKDMMINLHSIATLISQDIKKQIDARVAEILGYTNTNGSEIIQSKPHRRYKARKQIECARNSTDNPIELLDGYELLHQRTNTNERNQFKDIGFEMALKMAHAVIKALGPVDGTTAAFQDKQDSIGTKVDLSTKARSATVKILKQDKNRNIRIVAAKTIAKLHKKN